MPTPLTPDEEFDARFRRGLEHHPEQPELAAWHRMDLLLDADLRQQALRRQVLRMLGVESVLLVLLLWSAWLFGGERLPLAPGSGRATAGRAHPAGALAATGPGNLTPPESPIATRAASATLSASQPANGPSEQAAAVANVRPTAQNDAAAAVDKTRAAVAKATAGRRRPPTSPLLAAVGEAKRSRPRGNTLTEGRLATSTNNPSAASARRPKARRWPVATAAPATEHRPSSRALAAERRPPRPVKPLFGREAKTTQPASAVYSEAGLVASGGRKRARAQRPKLPQQLVDEGIGGQRPASRRARQAAASLPTTDTRFGTAIAPLALLVPTTELPFTRPDSLRPVVLAARVRPTDSLPPPPVRPQRYRLRLGLVAAPELSTVRTNRLSPPGPSVGVQLDYQLARRWHLSTAFLYSVKRYGAADSDYHLPAGYTLPHGWVITDVAAACRIIDLPLNLRYDLWQQPRYQVFASAGLSSLLMKREQYTYDYAPVYGKPVAPYTFELSNGSQHFLKVLNLSAGYERRLGPRWSVQAESFVKLPLAGVGYGAVRLRSAGVFFSLRYGLLPVRPAPTPALR